MNTLAYVVSYAIATSILGPIVFTLKSFFVKLVCYYVLYELTITDTQLVRRFDNEVLITSSRFVRLGGRVVPGLGWHLIKLKSTQQWCLCQYEKENHGYLYRIYSLNSLLHLSKSLFNEKDGINQLWFEPSKYDWQLIRPLNMVLPLPLFPFVYPHQQQAIDTIYRAFKAHPYNQVSAIIKGVSRSGKSTTANQLALAMMKDGFTATVVSGWNPGVSGMTLSLLEGEIERTSMAPLVIILDEYNELVNMAFKGSRKTQRLQLTNDNVKKQKEEDEEVEDSEDSGSKTKQCTSYASNKSTFLSFMDRIRSLPYVILIATTNLAILPDENSEYGPFYNSSRLQFRFHYPAQIDDSSSSDIQTKGIRHR